ncbi:MAG: DNA polymerase III subunit gamma/tau [Candidatus Sumerlaeia bacterium]
MAQVEAYQGLARKYRPQTFEDLVGQESVAQSLANSLRQGKVSHGHLMAGPRGVGKTTSARILARALNCEKGPTATPCGVCRHCIDIAAGTDLDVIEIDAASNTGVDNIRELRERVMQAPFSARFKVYIIDEVHMLSSGAFNALLKTLEEPPPSVVFVLATTEIEKVPETIRSRCVVHSFRRMTTDDIVRRLEQVGRAEGVELAEADSREIYGMIARSVEGGMRDALVALDQLLAMTENMPTVEAATRLMGLADQQTLHQTVAWIGSGDAVKLLGLVEDLVDRGRNLERFVRSLIAYLRELMLLQAGADERLLSLTGESLEVARGQARQIAPATLYNILNHVFELEERIKKSPQARFLLEFTLIRLASIKPVVPIDQIIDRINAIPEASFGAAPAPPQQKPKPLQMSEEKPAPAPARGFRPEAGTTNRYAYMHDSEPAPQPAPAPVRPSASGRELIEELIPQTPDYLGRYLSQAREATLEGDSLRLGWDGSGSFARKMLSMAGNIKAIEGTLANHFGRPIKLVNADAVGVAPAEPPKQSPRPPAPIMADSEPLDDYEPPQYGAYVPPKAAKPAAPADNRSAIEKAREFLKIDPEAARRVKLLREMLNGQVIDENGNALAVE